MVALVCVALHLSIQARAEQQAEVLVQRWAVDTGVSIRKVRYHLLRNGLVLQGLRLQRDDLRFSAKHLLIHANPKLLLGEHPRIGAVQVQGFTLQLRDPKRYLHNWHPSKALLRLWRATGLVDMHGGTLLIQRSDKARALVELSGFVVSQRMAQGKRVIHVSREGSIAEPVTLLWYPAKGETGMGSGALSWQGLPAGSLAEAAGLQEVSGILSGRVAWQSKEANALPVVDGMVTLRNPALHAAGSQQLLWSLKRHGDGGVSIKVKAHSWPIQLWSEQLPMIARRHLTHALLDAEFRVSRSQGGWSSFSRKGVLHDVTYAADAEEVAQRPNWYWEEIRFEDLRMDFSRKVLHARHLLTSNSSLVLQLPKGEQVVAANAHAGALFHAKEAQIKPWRMSVDRIGVEHMALGLEVQRGRLLIPSLKGQCSWNLSNVIDFDLHTPVSSANVQLNVSRWHLHGRANYHAGAVHRAAFQLQAAALKLAQLRAFLPLQGGEGKTLQVEGLANLDMSVEVEQGLWRAKGVMKAADVLVAHEGDRWQASKLIVRFGPVGMGMDHQSIRTLIAERWHYTTTLTPLSSLATGAAAEAIYRLPWWVADLQQRGWQFGRMNWMGGTVSLGGANAHWLKQLNLSFGGVGADEAWVQVHADGMLGGGHFVLKGKWFSQRKDLRFIGSASVQQAVPFFLNDWLQVSGMPKVLRGRLSATIRVKGDQARYRANVGLRLSRVLFDAAVSEHDPMLEKTGYSTVGLLERLRGRDQQVKVSFSTEGGWQSEPLTLARMGAALQLEIERTIRNHDDGVDEVMVNKDRSTTPVVIARVRLHDDAGLSHNERVRLRQGLMLLRGKPGWVIELQPKWSGETLNAASIARVRYTQILLEQFMLKRNLPKKMIYPLWPTERDHADDIGSIRVVMVPG